MSDAKHNQQKEALEDATNRVASYRGINIGTIGYTMTTPWVTHDDGSITGPSYAPPELKLSAQIKAILDAYLDGQSAPPSDPPPSDPVEPPPTDPTPPPSDGSGFKYLRGLEVLNPEYPPSLPPAGGTWSDTRTGATTMRMSDYTKFGANDNGGALRNVYSRYTAESCDKANVVYHGVGSPTAYIADRVSRDFVCELFDADDRPIGEPNEIRWDYTQPSILRYVQGMQFWEMDIKAGTKRLVRDFAKDFPSANLIMNNVEGDSSRDSSKWCWMAMAIPAKGSYYPVAIFTYDLATDEILGVLDHDNWGVPNGDTTGARLRTPNMVEVSPDGRYALIHWPMCWGSGSNPNTAADGNLARTHVDGPHCYPLDFNVERAVKVATDSTHSAWALDFNRKWRFVAQNNGKGEANGTSSADWIEATDPDLGWSPDGTNVIRILNQSQLGWATGYHFAGATGMPGWVLMSTYAGQQQDPGDNQLMLLPLKQNGSVLRVAPTYGMHDAVLQKGYFQEAAACISEDAQRIYWPGNFGGAAKTDVYSITLPADWQSQIEA